MKEKQNATPPMVPPISLPVPSAETDCISDADRALLDNVKIKRELALANAKTALAQSENSELTYNNIILQLAIKYKLSEGDVITENGTINRSE